MPWTRIPIANPRHNRCLPQHAMTHPPVVAWIKNLRKHARHAKPCHLDGIAIMEWVSKQPPATFKDGLTYAEIGKAVGIDPPRASAALRFVVAKLGVLRESRYTPGLWIAHRSDSGRRRLSELMEQRWRDAPLDRAAAIKLARDNLRAFLDAEADTHLTAADIDALVDSVHPLDEEHP